MLLIRKEHAGGDEPENVNYLVSVSDLMIAVLFIFILMVVILSTQVKQAKKKLLQDPLSNILNTIHQKNKIQGVKIEIDQKNGVITLPADDLFENGQSSLKPQGIENILKFKAELAEIIPCHLNMERGKHKCSAEDTSSNIETIFIEGHTDSKPLNRGIYNNYHLGLDRARAVYNVLADNTFKGYKNERGQPIFGFSSYGDERLKDPLHDAPNRRVEIRIIMSSFRPSSEMLSSAENE